MDPSAAGDGPPGREGAWPSRALRLVIVVGVLIVLGLLALELSGSARRTVGTNWVQEPGFDTTIPHVGMVCQGSVSLPSGAAYARIQIASYGRPLPAIELSYRDDAGQLLATGALVAGHAQGQVDIPIRLRSPALDGTLCLALRTSERLLIAGNTGALPSTVNGRGSVGAIGIDFLSARREAWWSILPTLARRFDYGKAGWIGSLTLPLVCLLLAVAWIATLTLLWRMRR